jgi:uncharacterized protein (TIGR00369 family)
MSAFGFKREDVLGTWHEVLGYNVIDWEDGRALLELTVKPEHRNLGKSVHGGVLASLVDIAGFIGGGWHPDSHNRAVTINLNTNFIAGTSADVIRAEGWRVRLTKGGTLFTRVRIYEPDTEKLLVEAQGTYKMLRPGTKESPGVKG